MGRIAINGLTEFNHWLRDNKIATFRNLVSQLNNFIFEISVALIPCNQRKKKNSLNYCVVSSQSKDTLTEYSSMANYNFKRDTRPVCMVLKSASSESSMTKCYWERPKTVFFVSIFLSFRGMTLEAFAITFYRRFNSQRSKAMFIPLNERPNATMYYYINPFKIANMDAALIDRTSFLSF